MNIDSIIFDLDGTLWDSAEGIVKSWNNVFSANKDIRSLITVDILKSVMGLQLKQIGDKLFPYLTEVQKTEIFELCSEEEKELLLREGGVLYPKLELTLQALSKSFPLFIVSNCQCGYIETFLEYHKLGKYFKGIECAGNTGLPKGENINRVIIGNHLKKPIYVGDTQGDCDAARLANIPFVFASYGFGEVAEYDFIIKEISELVRLFQKNGKAL